jgi:NADP-dependent 3-hydroxy acid dehydrogenase YdfG
VNAISERSDGGSGNGFGLLIGGIMNTTTLASRTQREPELLGQTVIVIGGSAGIGLETPRRARAEGADVILTARNPERLQRVASELASLLPIRDRLIVSIDISDVSLL